MTVDGYASPEPRGAPYDTGSHPSPGQAPVTQPNSEPSADLKARFRSLYRHGFARVAACTGRSHPGDPPRNADTVLALARTCHEAGAALISAALTEYGPLLLKSTVTWLLVPPAVTVPPTTVQR